MLVKLNKIAPEGVNLSIKVEAYNPCGSVKDCLTFDIIEDTKKSGAFEPEQTVIEAMSGNTGIGLAIVCAQKKDTHQSSHWLNPSALRVANECIFSVLKWYNRPHQKSSGILVKAIKRSEK